MALIEIQMVSTVVVDTDAYAAAAIEEEAFAEGEVTTDPDIITELVVGHFPVEEAIPRWARHCLTCKREDYTAGPVEDPQAGA